MRNAHTFRLVLLLLCGISFPIKSNFHTVQVIQELDELKNTNHLHSTINLAREIQVKILNNFYPDRDDLRAMDIQLLCVSLEDMIRSRIWNQERFIPLLAVLTIYLTVAFGILFATMPNDNFKLMQWHTWDGPQKFILSISALSGVASLIEFNTIRKFKAMRAVIDRTFQNKPLNNKKLKKIINFYYDTAIEAVKQQKSFMTMGFNNLINTLAYDKERILRSINEF